jgi:zinc transporter ZupT
VTGTTAGPFVLGIVLAGAAGLATSLGFAAGVMLWISFAELLVALRQAQGRVPSLSMGATGSRRRAFAWAFASGTAEPAGAVLAQVGQFDRSFGPFRGSSRRDRARTADPQASGSREPLISSDI